MTETPIRRRIQTAASQQSQQSGGANNAGWATTGRSGFEKSRQISAQNAKKMEYKIPRFGMWVGKNDQTPMNNQLEADVIILDAKIDDIYFAWEHQIQIGNSWDNFETCIGETSNCPLCEDVAKRGDSSNIGKRYYAMFLTVIDMRPFEWVDKDGVKQRREFQKKLLVVKQTQHAAYESIFRQVNGKIRGLHLLMTRNISDAKSPKSGVPSIADITAPHVSEEDIIASFGHEAIFSKKEPTRAVKQKNADCFAYTYSEILGIKDAATLGATYCSGYTGAAGSKAEAKKAFDEYENGDGNEVPFDTHVPEATGAPAKGETMSDAPSPVDDEEIPM